jgi:hypothetical protein
MPFVELSIHGVPIVVSTPSFRLGRLFTDYFRYYEPRVGGPAPAGDALALELKPRRELPPREKLIPALSELVARTGIARLWREEADGGERFYFDFEVAAFRVEPEWMRATGLVTPQSLRHPHILANTYALLALLLLLRSREVYHLHAAAVVSPRDELWLICGAQRAGKTTLTTGLGLAGWRPVSDDSLLAGFEDGSPRLAALRKDFHVGDELFERWPALRRAARRHHYLDRTCIGGLEFFGTQDLAESRFRRIDHIVLPEITREPSSRLAPLPRSQALLKLAEQSAFFQLWPRHTERQWNALVTLAKHAACHRLSFGLDLLADPQLIAAAFEQA